MRITLLSAHAGMLLLTAVTAAPGLFPLFNADAGTVEDAIAMAQNLSATTPTAAAPGNMDELSAKLESIWKPDSGRGFYDNIAAQISANILPEGGVSWLNSVNMFNPGGVHSYANQNAREPSAAVYPRIGDDPAYTMAEAQLRSAIYIPPTFTWGQKAPVIFVQCTGGLAHEIFESNILKLFMGSDFADPVWINVPGVLLDDAQISAEYIAYAINYLAGVTGRPSTVVSWSQGGLVVQWALTFWPSIRPSVRHFLPVSPDFKGTVLANVICLNVPVFKAFFMPCDVAVLQQTASSKFVGALKRHGGLDAWVPTTSFFSATYDTIVQPQTGKKASAYLKDGRGVGVLNVEPQVLCKGKPAGGYYGHATMLIHPLTIALSLDAMFNDGPPDVSRINLAEQCDKQIGDGLTILDAIRTAGLLASAGIRMLAYPWKTLVEPSLEPYCR